MNCNESRYELVGTIAAYALDDIVFSIPASVSYKYLLESEFSIKAAVKAISIPLRKTSGSAEESQSLNQEGLLYDTKVSWQMPNPTVEEMSAIEVLRHAPHHLILTSLGDNLMVLRTDAENYSFSYVEKGGVLECTVSVQSPTGLQRVLRE